MIGLRLSVLAVASFLRLCAAQAAGWNLDGGQVNSTMCYWDSPRVAVIRDTAYIDGGNLVWQPGLKDGSLGALISDGNPLGLVYQLNFSTSFNTGSNISDVLTTTSKASGGTGLANNVGPNFLDGGMLANDYEWATYGGLLLDTAAYQPQDANKVAIYQKYPQGPPKQFAASYAVGSLPDGITRYTTYGAAVSVPSENLGYYFGGLRSSTFGVIVQNPGRNVSRIASTNALTMIELDMSTQGSEKWNNLTLPTSVPGRASAEIIWVPVSQKGVLIAVGGVISPSYALPNKSNNAAANTESTRQSPKFLSTVSVYDIETSTWYEQETSNPPPGALAQGCSVVASAQDGSSHNIYWYGGFDGIHLAADFSDDVWVLSIPSFVWVKVKSGDPAHGRAGHRCVKPYPDQMLVIGGYHALTGQQPECLQDGIVQIFNLSSAEWITKYDPTVWSQYTVPQAVVSVIGGSPTGGATKSSPSPSGFSDSKLTSIFGSKYDSAKIVDWFPYKPSPTTNNTAPPSITPVAKSGSSTPSYLAPVLAVVLGLFFITLLILGFLLWRRRKYLKSNPTAPSEAGTMDNRHWVTNWLRSTPADNKALTVTTDETPMTPYEDVPYMPEVGGTQVHEMMDTSRPVELHDTGMVGFTPISGSQRRSNGLAASASVTSHTSQASTVSRDSQSPRPGISPMHTPRPDSPPLGGDNRFLSGVSNVSETDRGHLRGISETSVSTDGNYATPLERGEGLALQNMPPRAPPEGRPNVVSPLTPPSAISEGDGSDYLGAGRSPGSTRRRSNFEENLDEARK